MNVFENYLDPDVSYLLGLIVARGTLHETTGDKKIIIEFPFKNLIAEGIRKQFVQEDHMHYSLFQIRERLFELTESNMEIERTPSSARLIIRFLRNSINWRNINHLLLNRHNYYDFEIPEQIYNGDSIIKKEFVRGIADCAGFIRESNNYMGGKRRVYIEIHNRNWKLPIQLCDLLQRHLSVPVQLIQWGHPNTREPGQTKKKGTTWAREHQVKIFSEAFHPIGFYVKYKNEILNEFAKDDAKKVGHISICNPNPKIRRKVKKPKHREENNPILPPELRGKHYNSYWKICLDLGCKQCTEVDDKQIPMFEDVIEDTGDEND
jgi:hypothetical protein